MNLPDRRSLPIVLGVGAVALLLGLVAWPALTPKPVPSPSSTPTATATTTPPSPSPASPLATPAPTVSLPVETLPPVPPVTSDPFPCGEADPTCASAQVQSVVNVPFTDIVDCGGFGCQLAYDQFWPPAGGRLATVVMLPGGPLPPGNRSSLWQLARYIAARGAVVFVADYRSSPAYGGGRPTTFQDVGCAIQTARALAPERGGSASSVSLIAHSYGAFPAAVVATTDDVGATTECLARAGSSRPERLAGIAGVYLPGQLDGAFVEQFVGGSRDAMPEGWRAVDAAQLADQADPVPTLLVTGAADPTGRSEYADELAAALGEADYPVTRVTVPEAGHDSVLWSAVTVDAIEALLNQGR